MLQRSLIGFDRVAQDVESRRCRNGRRKRSGVLRVDDTERRLEPPMGNPGLGAERLVIEDRNAGGFASGPGRGWNRDQGLDWAGNGLTFADRRIHVVQKVGRPATVEVGGFGCIDRGAAPHGDEGVVISVRGKPDRFLQGLLGWLDSYFVEDGESNPVVLQRLERGYDRR
jgi:hypothetical protein